MSTKVWNLMYQFGATERVIGDAGNPQTRKSALEGAETITKNGWCGWVEHHTTGKRLLQNPAELAYQQSLYYKRIIEFAQANVPGFAQQR